MYQRKYFITSRVNEQWKRLIDQQYTQDRETNETTVAIMGIVEADQNDNTTKRLA